jgi:hypothetical protein
VSLSDPSPTPSPPYNIYLKSHHHVPDTKYSEKNKNNKNNSDSDVQNNNIYGKKMDLKKKTKNIYEPKNMDYLLMNDKETFSTSVHDSCDKSEDDLDNNNKEVEEVKNASSTEKKKKFVIPTWIKIFIPSMLDLSNIIVLY